MIGLRDAAADTDLDLPHLDLPHRDHPHRDHPHRDHPHRDRLRLDDAAQLRFGAERLAAGAAVAHGFANHHVITSRGDAATVRWVNLLTERPADQTGGIAAPAWAISRAFDWSVSSFYLSRATAEAIFDAFLLLGPFGFRGPAAAHIPAHLSSWDGTIRTAQVITPGYSCPSNRFLELASDAVGGALYVTTVDAAEFVAGAASARSRAGERNAAVGSTADLVVFAHHDEAGARNRYPRHRLTSPTILGFQRPVWRRGRVHLTLERHGSLSADTVAAVLERFDLGLVTAPSARTRLPDLG